MHRAYRGTTGQAWYLIFLASGCWLPVDGVKSAVELLGTGKFPLAEYCPQDENSTNGGCNSDEDGQCGALG